MFVAFGTLIVLLVDTFITGWPALSKQLLTGLAVDGAGGGRCAPCDSGDALPRPARPALLGADRRTDGDLPRGVREPRALVESPDRGEHPEPRRSSGDRLRDPGPRIHRARDRCRPRRARRRTDPHTRRPADGRRVIARSNSRRSGLDSPGRLRARRDEVAGRVAAGAARRRSPASRPARSLPSRVRSAKPRR